PRPKSTAPGELAASSADDSAAKSSTSSCSWQQIRNPNLEIRNKSETRNPKKSQTRTRTRSAFGAWDCGPLPFVFVSDFEISIRIGPFGVVSISDLTNSDLFQISGFGFRICYNHGMSNARVILQPRRARPFYARHPWVFAGAIARVEGE